MPAKASFTAWARGIVGLPISFESCCPSSNKSPFEAPVSQPAKASAKASGKPEFFNLPAYSDSLRSI